MDEERKYPDIKKLYEEAYDTAYMDASIRAASPQKPVAWLLDIDGEQKLINLDTKRISFKDWAAKPLFFATAPPQRTWVGLTDDEIFEIHKQVDSMQYLTFGHAIEAKLKEKNT